MSSKVDAVGIPTRHGYMPGTYILRLLDIAPEIDHRRLLPSAKAALQLSRIELSKTEFAYEDYLSIVGAALAQQKSDTLGLKFGSSFVVRDYGILGYALLSCANLRQSLNTFQNLDELFGSISAIRRSIGWTTHSASFQVQVEMEDEPLRVFETQAMFAQFMAFRSLLEDPSRFQISSLSFEFSAPADLRPYEQMFGCRPQFNQQLSELLIPDSVLDEPFALSNEDACRICEEQCELLVRGMDKSQSVPLRVRQLILLSPGSVPDLATLSGRLGMSARTLRRHLANADTSYQDIVAEVRQQLACRYLEETTMPIKEIGFLLGYSDSNNFHRAFKRLVGRTPSEHREVGRRNRSAAG